jgi:hypothetical protein
VTVHLSVGMDVMTTLVCHLLQPLQVFYRINSSKQPSLSVNELLKRMRSSQLPLLLLWGDLDPWITSARVRRCCCCCCCRLAWVALLLSVGSSRNASQLLRLLVCSVTCFPFSACRICHGVGMLYAL